MATEPNLSKPCALVLFGATGDLMRRKLIPALYNLLLDDMLPERFAVVAVARKEPDREELLTRLRDGVERYSRRAIDDETWVRLERAISILVADAGSTDGLAPLSEHLAGVDREFETAGNRLFYLAVPPSAYAGIVGGLGEAGLQRPGPGGSFSRIILEKPIGHDLESAQTLNRAVNDVFGEDSVYRIDHYLGKETVQNLLVFRFANAIFEPLWNQKYVDHVQITVAESIGVEERGAYYEEAGTARDMLQNHLFQLVCLTAMEPPASLRPDAIRNEKVKVLEALRPLCGKQVSSATVRGQYAQGVIDGKEVPGYRAEPGVSPESRTETYVATELFIDNWRWAGVPFYLRAGKRMNKRVTEIALRFREVPHHLFPDAALTTNTLALRIQPEEAISIKFDAKIPGTEPRIKPVEMEFDYEGSFADGSPEAYERLISDAMNGDSTLFIRRDEVEAAWGWIDPLQEAWAAGGRNVRLPEYTAGTWGPAEAHVMLARSGRTWRRL
ncbi:MAG: glucose-6-phosphate dehydrogenase [Acidobacteria bacterium]|nr:glucose-6-phosphate dehydrogenase [Acidobacteriota bacterium]